ncbi:MAG: hypothetical protein NWR96_10060 [Crocinitomicaceae bacterium]|jgi:hypothetical protein|nr:hypothetical protein [Crocinitomicaceae bacterium]MDP4761967.1 hypothetical protein [Crocinitomicaceae bacterium]
MYRFKVIFIGVLLALGSCAPARFVEPLKKGQQVLTGNFGGPVAKIPGIGSIPIPFTAVGYGYGVSDKTTVFGNLHTTSLAFGVGQTDIGVSQSIWKNDKMGISTQGTMNILVDFYTGANRFWPQVDANYYFRYGKHSKPVQLDALCKIESKHYNLLYAGISNWFDPYKIESQGRPNAQFWIPSVQIGHQWIRPKWSYQAELKMLAPNQSNENIVVNYPSLLNNRGAIGLYFGITYHLK